MMLVLLNCGYSIAEELHNNDVRSLSNWTLCSVEGVNSESNGVNWIKYAMIRYKINNNSALSDKLHNIVDNHDSQVMSGL